MKEHGSKKAILAACAANFGIMVIKAIVALISGSSAMFAEAIHSGADMGNQLLLLVGMKRSAKAPDKQHPFGYGKEQYFWAFLVAVVLFILGAAFSLYEGIHKIMHPEAIKHPLYVFIVLGVSIVLEGGSFFVAFKEFTKTNKGNILSNIKRSKDSNIVVVLVEDTAALLGLITAFVGVSIALLTGMPIFDSMASIIIGLILGVVAIFLANEMRTLLIGEGATDETVEKIRSIVSSKESVEKVGKILTMHLGPEEILTAIDVDFKDAINVCSLETIIDEIKKEIRREIPSVRRIYIEAETLKRYCADSDS
ncbi:MAG: cation transporter [Nitrospirae bacterium]|nr:cation transporter [Nitrospirota bacterium]